MTQPQLQQLPQLIFDMVVIPYDALEYYWNSPKEKEEDNKVNWQKEGF